MKMTLISIYLQNVKVNDYCVAYKCVEGYDHFGKDSKWEIGLKTCICPIDSVIEKLETKIDQSLPKCCGKNLPRNNLQGTDDCSKYPTLTENDLNCVEKSAEKMIYSDFELGIIHK